MTNQCKCCGATTDTRMGYCFDCVECESVIAEGVDMYDKEIPKPEGMSKTMSQLKYILAKYNVRNARD